MNRFQTPVFVLNGCLWVITAGSAAPRIKLPPTLPPRSLATIDAKPKPHSKTPDRMKRPARKGLPPLPATGSKLSAKPAPHRPSPIAATGRGNPDTQSVGLADARLRANESAPLFSLEDTIALTLANNPRRTEAQAAVNAATSNIGAVGSQGKLQVNANGTTEYGRNTTTSNGLATAASSGSSSGSGSTDGSGGTGSTSSASPSGAFQRFDQLTVDASLPITTGGRVKASTRQARYQAVAQIYQLAQVEQDLILSTTLAYLDVLRATQLLRVTNANLSVSQERLRIAQVRYSVGASARLDVLRAQTDLADARSRRIQAVNALGNNNSNLNVLLGRAPETPIRLVSISRLNLPNIAYSIKPSSVLPAQRANPTPANSRNGTSNTQNGNGNGNTTGNPNNGTSNTGNTANGGNTSNAGNSSNSGNSFSAGAGSSSTGGTAGSVFSGPSAPASSSSSGAAGPTNGTAPGASGNTTNPAGEATTPSIGGSSTAGATNPTGAANPSGATTTGPGATGAGGATATTGGTTAGGSTSGSTGSSGGGDISTGLQSLAGGTRQSLAVTQAQIGAAEAAVEIAKSGKRPQLALSLGALLRNPATFLGNFGASIGLGLAQNLFDSGRTREQVSTARSALDQLKARLAGQRLEVAGAIETSLLSLDSAQRRQTSADAGARSAQEALRVAQIGFRSGVRTTLDLADAQAALLSAQTDAVNSRFDVADAQATLAAAVGIYTVEAQNARERSIRAEQEAAEQARRQIEILQPAPKKKRKKFLGIF